MLGLSFAVVAQEENLGISLDTYLCSVTLNLLCARTWNIMCNSNYAVSEEDRIQGKNQYSKSNQR